MYNEIKTFSDAVKVYKHQIDPEKFSEALSFLPKELSGGMIALAMAQIVTWAINNDDPNIPEWKADYNDDDQEKYFLWYRGGSADGAGSGFSFDATSYVWSATDTCGGARLCFKDEERALHFKEFFMDLHKELYLIIQ